MCHTWYGMGNVSFVCIPCHWWEIYGIVFSKLHRHHVKPPMSSTCYHKNRKHRGGIQVFPGHSLGPREVKHTRSLIIQSHHPKKTVTDLPNCLLACLLSAQMGTWWDWRRIYSHHMEKPTKFSDHPCALKITHGIHVLGRYLHLPCSSIGFTPKCR